MIYAISDIHGCYNKYIALKILRILMTGHTPTFLLRDDKQALVFEKNGHIGIDCGCVYGERLAAYCLNTGKAEYV